MSNRGLGAATVIARPFPSSPLSSDAVGLDLKQPRGRLLVLIVGGLIVLAAIVAGVIVISAAAAGGAERRARPRHELHGAALLFERRRRLSAGEIHLRSDRQRVRPQVPRESHRRLRPRERRSASWRASRPTMGSTRRSTTTTWLTPSAVRPQRTTARTSRPSTCARSPSTTGAHTGSSSTCSRGRTLRRRLRRRSASR